MPPVPQPPPSPPELETRSTSLGGETESPVVPPQRVFRAEAITESVSVVDERSWPFRFWGGIGLGLEWCFGLASLIAGLAAIASVPILQFVSLGYLLEVSGRVSRSGRLRDGFFEIRPAARIGSFLLGTWLMILPLRYVADLRYSAMLIDPESGIAAGWQIAAVVVTWVMMAHIVLAWYCGGRIRHFLWPFLAPIFFGMWMLQFLVSHLAEGSILRPLLERISPRLLRDLTNVPPLTSWFPPAVFWHAWKQGGMYTRARDAVWETIVGLRLPYYFWLGIRGFAGAIAWLFVPIMMMIATTKLPLDDAATARGLGGLLGFVGSVLLAVVVLYLPFLQAHFAAERKLVAFFEIGKVRNAFRRAPIAFWMALLVTLLFAIPLYLLKVAVVPREVIWLPSLVFVVFIFPARLITGWSLGRARHREQPRFFLFRWMARFSALPIVGFYAFVIYFTQYTSWYGSWSLIEQHAFLTPVPFLSL